MPNKGYRQSPEHRAAIAVGVSNARRVRSRRDATSKVCSRCQRWRPLEAFGVSRDRWDGLQANCRDCRREQYHEDRERDRERAKRWRQANAERLAQSKQAYYRANRERIAAREREKYLENRERKIAYQKAYYLENREKGRASRAAYARANRGVFNESNRRRHARKQLATVVPVTQTDLDAKWAYWAGRCWMCGDEADTWDHVKPLLKGGAHMLVNLRPACRHCNCSKRATWPFTLAA